MPVAEAAGYRPFPGDLVQVYVPKALGRVGVVAKIVGDKADVWIQGKGIVKVPLDKMIPVPKGEEGEAGE